MYGHYNKNIQNALIQLKKTHPQLKNYKSMEQVLMELHVNSNPGLLWESFKQAVREAVLEYGGSYLAGYRGGFCGIQNKPRFQTLEFNLDGTRIDIVYHDAGFFVDKNDYACIATGATMVVSEDFPASIDPDIQRWVKIKDNSEAYRRRSAFCKRYSTQKNRFYNNSRSQTKVVTINNANKGVTNGVAAWYRIFNDVESVVIFLIEQGIEELTSLKSYIENNYFLQGLSERQWNMLYSTIVSISSKENCFCKQGDFKVQGSTFKNMHFKVGAMGDIKMLLSLTSGRVWVSVSKTPFDITGWFALDEKPQQKEWMKDFVRDERKEDLSLL